MNNAESIDRIIDIARPTTAQIDERNYEFHGSDGITLLKPPIPSEIGVTTLQGFVDLVQGGLEALSNAAEVICHVVDPTTVKLIAKKADRYGQRQVFAVAALPKGVELFRFGTWMDPEPFTIGIQAGFQRSLVESADGAVIGDTEYVIRVASHLTADLSTLSQDDGISQNVTVKQGIATKANEQLKSRVMLSPYRTFPEVNQPLSTFVFRVRALDGETIHCALFEADGGRWRTAAAEEIAKWLGPKLDPIPVVR